MCVDYPNIKYSHTRTRVFGRPQKLIRQLEKRSDIGILASKLDGEVVAGEAVAISPDFFLTPFSEPMYCDLPIWLVDVYVREPGVMVNLADVVEQAARDCNYFGRFVVEESKVQVVRTDNTDEEWQGPQIIVSGDPSVARTVTMPPF